MNQQTRLMVIGGGNMGSAIVQGVLAANFLQPGQLVIVEPDHKRRDSLRLAIPGLALAPDVRSGPPSLSTSDVILLAVKPQVFPGVCDELRLAGGLHDRLIVSIMAGISIDRLSHSLHTNRVARVMPNLPASVRKGISALCFSTEATHDDRRFANDLLRCVGETIPLDESLMDAFTAVAGSGPAYLFLLAESLVEGAVSAGFDRRTAERVVRQVLLGSSEMLARDSRDPAVLRASVTSRGGTTAAALDVLEQANVRDAFQRAILAARDRGRMLGNQA